MATGIGEGGMKLVAFGGAVGPVDSWLSRYREALLVFTAHNPNYYILT